MALDIHPEIRSFTADIALFQINPISAISLPSEAFTLGGDVTGLADLITNARFNVNIETMASKAAKDVRNSAIQGFGRNLPVHLSWMCEFEHIVDSAADAAVLLYLMLNPAPTAPDENLSEKYRGFVYLAANRGGGGGSTHQIKYEGYGFFSRVRWHAEEGASTISATITGYGPLVMSQI